MGTGLLTRTPVALRVTAAGRPAFAVAEALAHPCRWLRLVEYGSVYLLAHHPTGLVLPGGCFLDYDRAKEAADALLTMQYSFYEDAIRRLTHRGIWRPGAAVDTPLEMPVYHLVDWLDQLMEEYDARL